MTKCASFKPIACSLALLILACGSVTAAPGISVGSTAAAPGGSGSVPVILSGNTTGVALQFDLVFDSTVVVAASVNASYASANHILASGQPTNGVLRVILYSLSNAQLNNGALINFQLSTAAAAAEGLVNLVVTNVVMADANASSVQPITAQPGILTISAGAGSQLTLLVRMSSGQVQLQLKGPAGKLYILQGSRDLLQWTNLSTNVLAGGQINLTDITATNLSQRFYRANYAP